MGENLLEICLDNAFLDTSNKNKNKQAHLIKLKRFYTKKGNYKQDENTALRMGENKANEITDKGLISKIYTQLIQLNTRKTTQSKVGKRPKHTFH